MALLIMAAALEGVCLLVRSTFLERALKWLLGLGAGFAVITAATGWFLVAYEHIRSDHLAILAWHRWLGTGTALLSLLAWVSVARGGTHSVALRCAAVWGAALLVIAAGYFGGELVWGTDWFTGP